jgi:hypothetical protein
MDPIQNSRISEVKISFKASGAVRKSIAAVHKERKLSSTRSALMRRISRKAMQEIERKRIDPLFCNRFGPGLGLRICRDDDVPLSVFKLVWLLVNVISLYQKETRHSSKNQV